MGRIKGTAQTMEVRTYRMRPVEAIWYTSMRIGDRIVDWSGGAIEWASEGPGSGREGLIIHTDNGDVRAPPRVWIVKGVQGDFYPVVDAVFQATYEPA